MIPATDFGLLLLAGVTALGLGMAASVAIVEIAFMIQRAQKKRSRDQERKP